MYSTIVGNLQYMHTLVIHYNIHTLVLRCNIYNGLYLQNSLLLYSIVAEMQICNVLLMTSLILKKIPLLCFGD